MKDGAFSVDQDVALALLFAQLAKVTGEENLLLFVWLGPLEGLGHRC